MTQAQRDEYRELVERSERLDAMIRNIKRTDYIDKGTLLAIADIEREEVNG